MLVHTQEEQKNGEILITVRNTKTGHAVSNMIENKEKLNSQAWAELEYLVE